MMVNAKSGAIAIESVVTYFRIRLGVRDRTKEIIEVVKMPDTLYRFDPVSCRYENLTRAQLCHPTIRLEVLVRTTKCCSWVSSRRPRLKLGTSLHMPIVTEL
jgi:hypothetical protein